MQERRTSLRSLSKRLQSIIGKGYCTALRKGFPNFDVREYQVLALQESLKHLRSNQNTLLLLDPGLGKTLVSQLCFLGLIRLEPTRQTKGLVLVPSRLLRDQHFKAANWFVAGEEILNIDSSKSRYPTLLRSSFEKASWIITTPKRLDNALRRDYRLRQLLTQVRLCVVDEFDAQAAEDIDAEGEPLGRLSKAADQLVRDISKNRTLFLCMSATQRAAAAPWLKTFKLAKVEVPHELLHQYSAYARVTFLPIADPQAIQADEQISLTVLDSLRKIREQLTHEFLTDPEIDPERLYRQASRVFGGSRHKIYFPPPLSIHVDVGTEPQLRAYLARFLQAYAERLALYEGRLDRLTIEKYERPARINDSDDMVPVESVRHIVYSNSPTPNQKIVALVSMLTKHSPVRGLVLTRNTDINLFILQMLSRSGIAASSITGEMDDSQRRQSLATFENGDTRILIVNRQLGGRGFDLPIARYAIFISPKRSEDTMWQEMLRIRSTRRDTKEVSILYFSDTREEEKAYSLLDNMIPRHTRYYLTNPTLDESHEN